MTLEAKVQDRREAKDKKKLEKFIERKVDYIDDCFASISYLLEDAQLTLLEALSAAEEYEERFASQEEEA